MGKLSREQKAAKEEALKRTFIHNEIAISKYFLEGVPISKIAKRFNIQVIEVSFLFNLFLQKKQKYDSIVPKFVPSKTVKNGLPDSNYSEESTIVCFRWVGSEEQQILKQRNDLTIGDLKKFN